MSSGTDRAETGVPRPLAAAALLLGAAVPALAAPLPPVPPFDVCGTVVALGWLPAHREPAIKGMSGSAGVDRSWPERLAVVLDRACTDDPEALALSNMFQRGTAGSTGRDLAEGQALLVLPEVDIGAVTLGRGICVSGFKVSGDEGGTWTRFGALVQLPQACAPGCAP